ncbi:Uncharacterised protein [Bordetella pertussis]|nr:Uncharacterised protein [Bordetella pertussis]CFW49518.1 Uncharacterised protein [Bordetella pertussis]
MLASLAPTLQGIAPLAIVWVYESLSCLMLLYSKPTSNECCRLPVSNSPLRSVWLVNVLLV